MRKNGPVSITLDTHPVRNSKTEFSRVEKFIYKKLTKISTALRVTKNRSNYPAN